MTKTTRNSKRILAGSLLAATVAVTLGGCSAITHATADSYSITYQLTASGTGADSLDAVTYDRAKERGDDSTSTKPARVTTKSHGTDSSRVWKTKTIVTAEKTAAIEAVPGAGTTATCRILIDGTKQIAEKTSSPGERVRCEAVTPAFSK